MIRAENLMSATDAAFNRGVIHENARCVAELERIAERLEGELSAADPVTEKAKTLLVKATTYRAAAAILRDT